MSYFTDIYAKSLAENQRNISFWTGYKQNLEKLDLNTYADKLKVPALIPIGSRIFFRGEIKHTNEITVALGADYFAKCSLKTAQLLQQHRLKRYTAKLHQLNKEREYLIRQIEFGKHAANESQGQEIIEDYNEEEDKAWRLKHREKVKQYKQQKIVNETVQSEITDDELWQRLEELELKEEFENEFDAKDNSENDLLSQLKEQSFILKSWSSFDQIEDQNEDQIEDEKGVTKEFSQCNKIPKLSLKLELLQQVIDKQKELDSKLIELKNKDRPQCKTEKEIISKLEEIEQLEELEDEMDRLDGIIEPEESDSEKEKPLTSKKTISFEIDDDAETLEITFKHSDVEPSKDSYDPTKGVLKPSDIYKAYSHLFSNGIVSILKKKQNEITPEIEIKSPSIQSPRIDKKNLVQSNDHVNKTIDVRDVVEKSKPSTIIVNESRPASIFKQQRQKNKK